MMRWMPTSLLVAIAVIGAWWIYQYEPPAAVDRESVVAEQAKTKPAGQQDPISVTTQAESAKKPIKRPANRKVKQAEEALKGAVEAVKDEPPVTVTADLSALEKEVERQQIQAREKEHEEARAVAKEHQHLLATYREISRLLHDESEGR